MSSHATIRAAVAELYRELPAAPGSQYVVLYSDGKSIDLLAGPFDALPSANSAAHELYRDGYTACRIRRLV